MNGKDLLIVLENPMDAAEMASRLNVDPLEVISADETYQNALRAISSVQWHVHVKEFLEKSTKRFEELRDERVQKYPTIQPFSKRKAFFEERIIPLAKMIKRNKVLLASPVEFHWTPALVQDLKKLGIKPFVARYWMMFFPKSKVEMR